MISRLLNWKLAIVIGPSLLVLLGDLELIISSSTRIRASLSRVGETTLSRPLSSRGDDNGDPTPKNVLTL